MMNLLIGAYADYYTGLAVVGYVVLCGAIALTLWMASCFGHANRGALKPTKPWPHKQPAPPTATPDEQHGLRIIEHTTYVPHPRLRAILALALTAGACAGALAGWLASGGIQ